MGKGIENSFLELLEAEVTQIAICVEGIRTCITLAKEEAAMLERDADENV